MPYRLKIGPHLLQRGDPDATKWLLGGAPSVCKLVNCGIPGEFVGRSDSPLWVGRVYENYFDPNNPVGGGWSDNPVFAAHMWVDRFLHPSIKSNPEIQAWELNNEPVINSLERMEWFARFCAEGARILRTVYGKTAIIGNWSVGNPGDPHPEKGDLSLWASWRAALAACKTYGAVLGRHSYGHLNEQYALRHRLDNKCFTAMGYPDLPVFIGECGAEALPGFETWRGQFKSNALEYAAYLAAFDHLLSQDSYVIGATVFTYGNGWPAHNINGSGVGELMAEHGVKQPGFSVAWPVAKNQAPAPTPVPLPVPQSWKGKNVRVKAPLWLHRSPDSKAETRITVLSQNSILPVIEDNMAGWLQVTSSPAGWCSKGNTEIVK